MSLNDTKPSFRVIEYRIALEGWKERAEGVFCFLTDLHGRCHGANNEALLGAIREISPDLILCGGDMNVKYLLSTLKTAYHLLADLTDVSPVIMAPGNHESFMESIKKFRMPYRSYLERVEEQGVHVLRNSQLSLKVHDQNVTVTGAELPLRFYGKPFPRMMTERELEALTGLPAPGSFNILLSHNPRYADAYFEWGADLTLCGHTHGGVVRFGRHTGAFSPQDLFFPKYCCGDFYREGSAMIVSAGLGEHTIPVRVHDPRELVVVRVNSRRV